MKKLMLILVSAVLLFGGMKNYKADINNATLKEMIKEGVPVIDVRTPPEWSFLGVIPGSKRIMFFDERGEYNLNGFIKKLDELGIKESDKVVIICRSGNRSVHVSNMLTEKGFENVYNVKKGIKGWIKDGGEVTKNFY